MPYFSLARKIAAARGSFWFFSSKSRCSDEFLENRGAIYFYDFAYEFSKVEAEPMTTALSGHS
jgi:hypothetical protein